MRPRVIAHPGRPSLTIRHARSRSPTSTPAHDRADLAEDQASGGPLGTCGCGLEVCRSTPTLALGQAEVESGSYVDANTDQG